MKEDTRPRTRSTATKGPPKASGKVETIVDSTQLRDIWTSWCKEGGRDVIHTRQPQSHAPNRATSARSLVEPGPRVAQWSNSATNNPTLVEVGPSQANKVELGPSSAQAGRASGPSVVSTFARLRPTWTAVGSTSAKLGPDSTQVGRVRSELARFGGRKAYIPRLCTTLAPERLPTNMAQIGGACARESNNDFGHDYRKNANANNGR